MGQFVNGNKTCFDLYMYSGCIVYVLRVTL